MEIVSSDGELVRLVTADSELFGGKARSIGMKT